MSLKIVKELEICILHFLKVELTPTHNHIHTNFCCLIISLSSYTDSPEKTASYSLYVVGSNGVLTEHVLQPQKLSSAADGEDAPVELARFPKTAWRLMGYVSTHTQIIELHVCNQVPYIVGRDSSVWESIRLKI